MKQFIFCFRHLFNIVFRVRLFIISINLIFRKLFDVDLTFQFPMQPPDCVLFYSVILKKIDTGKFAITKIKVTE